MSVRKTLEDTARYAVYLQEKLRDARAIIAEVQAMDIGCPCERCVNFRNKLAEWMED